MIIDLTLPISEGMYMPKAYWHPNVEITVLGAHETEGRASRKVVLGTHTGTHIDAPLHFLPDGYPIDEMDLDLLIGKAQLLDVSFVGEKQGVTAEDLNKAVQKLPEGLKSKRVVLKTGWLEKAWGTPEYASHRPYLTMSAAEWFNEKGVKLLAMDIPDPDSEEDFVPGKPSPIHVYCFKHDIVIIESIANLSSLPSSEFTLVALPLKLKGGDASPGRIVAIV